VEHLDHLSFAMMRQVLVPGLLFAVVAACTPTPMRWEKSGVGDPTRDEAACRAAAREEASRQLPYGNGPPIFGGYRRVSMIQWTQAIDNERSFFAEDLTKACMRDKGFVLVPMAERANRP
jgi:hypothetical protein